MPLRTSPLKSAGRFRNQRLAAVLVALVGVVRNVSRRGAGYAEDERRNLYSRSASSTPLARSLSVLAFLKKTVANDRAREHTEATNITGRPDRMNRIDRMAKAESAVVQSSSSSRQNIFLPQGYQRRRAIEISLLVE